MTLNQLKSLYPNKSALARDLNVDKSTVTKWFTRGRIPRDRQYDIAELSGGRLKVDKRKKRA